jgi:hypothetical protein
MKVETLTRLGNSHLSRDKETKKIVVDSQRGGGWG